MISLYPNKSEFKYWHFIHWLPEQGLVNNPFIYKYCDLLASNFIITTFYISGYLNTNILVRLSAFTIIDIWEILPILFPVSISFIYIPFACQWNLQSLMEVFYSRWNTKIISLLNISVFAQNSGLQFWFKTMSVILGWFYIYTVLLTR